MADSNMGTDSPPLSNTSLAVLIDADNTPPKIVDGLFEEIAKFGTASVKRIYGDWTKPNLGGWKSVLLKHSVQPIQQFAYTQGKNATDCSMIIDAMDLLYTKQLSGFCLVSSDSDFTRLAARLREEGLTVYGFGERKMPGPFVAACDKFIYTEVLRSDHAPESTSDKPDTPAQTEAPVSKEPPPLQLIANVIDDISDEDDWANLGTVGQHLSKRKPDFDTRLFGHKKLSDMIRAYPKWFQIQKGQGKSIQVKTLRK
ncbi:NYN domain-containing protein [Alcanivorax sp.]|uniref:NYN domain-containing protein n=1 Tax=Alcanivorax sp. TaxID=1872427 RepID=UPI000C103D41|nr:NYN domain-containing protein [Alcanivorax sp.]PHR63468.1 MAG: hypothetical protein COA55_16385 [Alcanivorax sp.]